MIHSFTLLLLITNITLLGVAGYGAYLLFKQYFRNRYGVAERKFVRIGIYAMAKKEISSLFTKPFMRYIQKYTSLNVEFLEPEIDKNSRNEALEYFIESDVDLILCIGNMSTEYIAEFLHMREIKIPVVVCGLMKEVISKGYFESLRKHINITGTITPYGWDDKIQVLTERLKIKKLGVIHSIDPNTMTTSVLKEKNFLNAALRKYAINVTMVNVYSINSVSAFKENKELSNVDAVLFIRDNVVIGNTQKYAEYFRKLGVPVILSEREQLQYGFVFMGSLIEGRIGENCAKQALKVLESNTAANDIPIQNIAVKPNISVSLNYFNNEVTRQKINALMTDQTCSTVIIHLN